MTEKKEVTISGYAGLIFGGMKPFTLLFIIIVAILLIRISW